MGSSLYLIGPSVKGAQLNTNSRRLDRARNWSSQMGYQNPYIKVQGYMPSRIQEEIPCGQCLDWMGCEDDTKVNL